jgi:ribosomal-protein-alanine acetyltransferase
MTAVREAGIDDLAAIMTLERASFPTDAWTERTMRDELVSPHGRYLVLEEDGVVAGYAGLRVMAGSREGDIQTIAVAAASRGRGWGRTLLTALMDEATRRGVRELFLEVRADNPVAQSLYASVGFIEIGRRPRYYQPDDVDALVMRADLAGRGPFRTPPESAIRGENGPESGDGTRIDGVLHADPPRGADG